MSETPGKKTRRATGEHCEHGVQTFECPPGEGCHTPAAPIEQNAIADPLAWGRRAADSDRDVNAEQEARRRAVADIAAAHFANRAELVQEADRRAEETHRRVTAHIEQFGPPVPELADHTGIGLHHLSAVLNGDGELSVTEVHLLAGALGVAPAAWFGSPRPAVLQGNSVR